MSRSSSSWSGLRGLRGLRRIVPPGASFTLIGCLVAPLAAQTAAPPAARVATIVIAHGAGEDWNALVFNAASQVETGGPVEVALLMGPAAKDYRFQDAAERLVAQGAEYIVVVPLLVSSHSGHYDQIRYLVGETDSLSDVMRHHLRMAGIERAAVDVPMHLAPAIDDASEIAHVIADRARLLATSPPDDALFLIAHGPNEPIDVAAWMKNLRALATAVQSEVGFRDVRVGLVQDDAPDAVRAEAVLRVREIIDLQANATGRDVVVVPITISRGSLTDERLPRDLAGLPIRYNGNALLPHEGVARWIEARVRAMRESIAAAPPTAR